MNLILIAPEECQEGICCLQDARATHLKTFLHAAPGRTFDLGILNGPIGTGEVLEVTEDAVRFRVACDQPAPEPWFDLVLALTRPRQLKRILFQVATIGVRKLFLVGAEKVEKSYFSMHLLREEEYRPVLIEGLMQGKSTRLPEILVVPKLRDLWEQLPVDSGARVIANPAPGAPALALPPGIPLLAIGPDGGWTERETAAFLDHGFQPFSLGARPLRTDTAAVALSAVLYDRMNRL